MNTTFTLGQRSNLGGIFVGKNKLSNIQIKANNINHPRKASTIVHYPHILLNNEKTITVASIQIPKNAPQPRPNISLILDPNAIILNLLAIINPIIADIIVKAISINNLPFTVSLNNKGIIQLLYSR